MNRYSSVMKIYKLDRCTIKKKSNNTLTMKNRFFIGFVVFLAAVAIFQARYVSAEDSILPKKLAIYYGFPSKVNGLAGNIDMVTEVFSAYDIVVLGDALQFPQYTAAPGQIPYYGCDQNSHFDHDNTVEIISRLKTPPNNTAVYGYVTIGGENTARYCFPTPQPVPLSLSEIEERIDAWADMGVAGIFLDEAEYGFGSSRERQNAVINYVHGKGISVFINGFDPDDVFKVAVTNEVFYTTGYYAGTYSSIKMNPQGLSTYLGPNDIYLLEHFQIINGTYQDPDLWTSRSDRMSAYKNQYGVQVATVTTMADTNPPAIDCNQLFDQHKFDYAWWSTLLYGFDYMSWGEPLGFSAWGPCSNQLPFHTRPDPSDVGNAFTGTVYHPSSSVYTRTTTAGLIEINTSTHTGSYTPFAVTNQPPVARDDSFSTDAVTPVTLTNAELLVNDTDADNDPLTVTAVDTASVNGGTITSNGNETYTYMPADGFSGVDSFTYTISDSNDGTATARVNINVNSVSPPPVTPATLFPEAVTIMAGQYDWGTLASLKSEDSDTYDIKGIGATGGYTTDWYASATIVDSSATVSQLSVTYRGQYSRKKVSQEFYLYNYQTAAWEPVDTRSVGNTDDVTISATVSTDTGRYVSPQGEMKVRVRGFRAGANFFCWANYLAWEVQ